MTVTTPVVVTRRDRPMTSSHPAPPTGHWFLRLAALLDPRCAARFARLPVGRRPVRLRPRLGGARAARRPPALGRDRPAAAGPALRPPEGPGGHRRAAPAAVPDQAGVGVRAGPLGADLAGPLGQAPVGGRRR